MKLKEFPLSLLHAIRLRYIKNNKVKNELSSLPVIISLTTIPSRLSTLDIVIASLLQQNNSAKFIVLWLNNSLKNSLPNRLKALQNDKFIIRFCEGSSSYRKLLPSLRTYPNEIIVTCDDDIIYPKEWLDTLYQAHLRNPESIVTNAGRLIERNTNNELEAYRNWQYTNVPSESDNLLAIGFSGVLYPPNTFDDRVFNQELFMKLCPKADDLWFKSIGFLCNKKIYCTAKKLNFIPIINSQKEKLGNTNIKEDGNVSQWISLCEHFPELEKLG